MIRRIISLNDDKWRVGSVTQKPFGDVDDLAEVREWLPARVPGDVRLDLLNVGKIADPFYGTHNDESQWIDSCDWWYVRELDLELEPGDRAFLLFDGIDYQSQVFANDKQLGRHVGMFSRQIYELPVTSSERRAPRQDSQSAVDAQRSAVSVRVWGSDALPRVRLARAQQIWRRFLAPFFPPILGTPYPDRYATLKCQMQFGWDFAPRLRTCGIWDDASIVVCRSVFIRDAWIKSQIPNPKSQIAQVHVILQLDSDREQKAQVGIAVRGKSFAGEVQTFAFDLHLARGEQTHELAFDLEDVHLWNPWDRGEPNLYEIDIAIAADAPSDSLITTFGIRSVELAHSRGSARNAEPWTFVINGVPEFVRGANWVPLDAIPGRLTRADYAARLRQAREANINFLRVWGGGLREKRAFYDL